MKGYPRMGRPLLNLKRTTVRVDPNVMAAVEELVGKHRVAEFIRRAMIRELAIEREVLMRERKGRTVPRRVNSSGGLGTGKVARWHGN